MLRTPLRFALLPVLLAASCGTAADPGHAHGHPHDAAPAAEPEWPARALTIWTDRFEYFIEHDLVLVGRAAGLAVHVTRLEDGAPRVEGPLRLVLRQGDETVEAVLAAPERPGIYLHDFTLPREGEWTWTLEVDGDLPQLPAVRAHADTGALAAEAEELPEDGDGVVLLKEQQWPLRMLTTVAAPRALQPRIPVTVTAAPCPGHAARVLAPLTGQLIPAGAVVTDWPELGQDVEAGAVLARLRVPLVAADLAAVESAELQRAAYEADIERGLAEAAAERDRAEAERVRAVQQFERVSGLVAVDAKSRREWEEAEADRAAAEAAAAAAEAVHRSWTDALARLTGTVAARHPEEAFLDLEVRAPIAGRLVAAPTGPGGWVDASALVFEILDTRVLHYLVRVPEQELAGLDDPRTLVEAGESRSFELPGEAGELRLARPLIDPRTRTGEIVYEGPNTAGLSPGAIRQGWLADGPAVERLAVPATALVDEDGLDVVFVQPSGELFERRVVRTGMRDGGMVEVLEGLRPGDRVVHVGAFVVRLASLSGAIPEHSH